MKRILYLLLLLPSFAIAQLSDAALNAEADSIKNETNPHLNNARRLTRMYKNIIASKPNFSFLGSLATLNTINNSNWSGTVLSVANGGTGTSSPGLIAGTNITITGSWPNQTINSGGSGGSGISSFTTTGTSGASTFSSGTLNIPVYQGQLTLTTTGTSGASTLVGTTLNIPNYNASPAVTTIINIGDWNMDSNFSLSVAHGLTASKIRSVQVHIIADVGAANGVLPLVFSDANILGSGGQYSWSTSGSTIDLVRYATGVFDSTDYDATSYNRGYIVIQSVP